MHCKPYYTRCNLLKGVYEFFDPKTIDERRIYEEKGPSDKIRWEIIAHNEENREYIKAFTHPEYHYPCNLPGLRYIICFLLVILDYINKKKLFWISSPSFC